jgi:hypothetical protein
MFAKVLCTIVVVGGLSVACGPAASANAHEGEPCSVTENDCGGDVECQLIPGRQASFCCPSPSWSSKKQNCQPLTVSN